MALVWSRMPTSDSLYLGLVEKDPSVWGVIVLMTASRFVMRNIPLVLVTS